MADINLKNLTGLGFSGSDLFEDSENFMVELSDENIVGGITVTIQSVCIGFDMETCGIPKKDPCAPFGSCAFLTEPFQPGW